MGEYKNSVKYLLALTSQKAPVKPQELFGRQWVNVDLFKASS